MGSRWLETNVVWWSEGVLAGTKEGMNILVRCYIKETSSGPGKQLVLNLCWMKLYWVSFANAKKWRRYGFI